ncbi:hypothetical protein BDV19DRAFT_388295 [Aspergillus venezuelensis]
MVEVWLVILAFDRMLQGEVLQKKGYVALCAVALIGVEDANLGLLRVGDEPHFHLLDGIGIAVDEESFLLLTTSTGKWTVCLMTTFELGLVRHVLARSGGYFERYEEFWRKEVLEWMVLMMAGVMKMMVLTCESAASKECSPSDD